MKKMMFIFMITFAALMYSCKESTVNPNDFNDQKDINLTKNVWVFSSSTTAKLPATTKFKFEKYGKLYGLKESEWNTGTWSLYYSSNLLILGGLTDIDSTTLVSVDDNKLVLKVTIENVVTELTYIPEALEMSQLTITGKINFDPLITNQDLTGAQVCICWFTSDAEKNMIVYGIGTIDANNKTFSIQVDNSFPISLFIKSIPGINGYFNMGFIALIWNENLKNGQTIGPNITNLEDNVLFGCVEDRAIHFIQGDYKNWSYNNMWHGDFIQGYNFCKGWYNENQQEHDGWEVDTTNSQIIIKVLQFHGSWSMKDFKFPNWG